MFPRDGFVPRTLPLSRLKLVFLEISAIVSSLCSASWMASLTSAEEGYPSLAHFLSLRRLRFAFSDRGTGDWSSASQTEENVPWPRLRKSLRVVSVFWPVMKVCEGDAAESDVADDTDVELDKGGEITQMGESTSAAVPAGGGVTEAGRGSSA